MNSLQFIEKSLSRHDYSGSPPVLINMVRAIEQILETVRFNPSARFGSCLTASKKNLSWVVHQALKPVCENLWVLPTLNATSVLTFLTIKAKPPEVFLAEEEIKRLCSLIPLGRNSPEKRALDLLYGTLGMLRNDFSPRRHSKKSKDFPYCPYCYREVMQKANTCHIHDGHRRTQGEYHYQRYEALKAAAKKLRLFNERIEPKSYLPLTKAKLLEKGVPTWPNNKIADAEDWIAQALKALDACDPRDRARIATQIAKAEKEVNIAWRSSCWPSAMKGTMFRYEIYLLTHLRTPAKDVADRLNRVWSGDAVADVAFACGVSRQILHRQVAKWGKSILELRSKGVKEEVIKLIYHLEALPPV